MNCTNLNLLMRDIRAVYEPLPKEEVSRLAVLWREKGDVSARNKLVESILPWAVKEAGRYCLNGGPSLDEILSSALEGVIEGVNRFDPSRGAALTTYVGWWVRRAIVAGIYDSHLIRVPNYCRARVSVHTEPLGNVEHRIAGPPVVREWEDAEDKQALLNRLREGIGRLPSRQAAIMYMRLEGASQKQIGRVLGITRAWVGQLEQKAHQQLRYGAKYAD